jgi:hypothetical protein
LIHIQEAEIFKIDMDEAYFNLLSKRFIEHEKVGVYEVIFPLNPNDLRGIDSWRIYREVLFTKNAIVLVYKRPKPKKPCHVYQGGSKCTLLYKDTFAKETELVIYE